MEQKYKYNKTYYMLNGYNVFKVYLHRITHTDEFSFKDNEGKTYISDNLLFQVFESIDHIKKHIKEIYIRNCEYIFKYEKTLTNHQYIDKVSKYLNDYDLEIKKLNIKKE